MPPELLVEKSQFTNYKVEKSQDVWSFGIVMYAVLFADLPWSRADRYDPDFSLYVEHQIGDHMGPWCLLSTQLLTLYRRMLAIHPTRRTNFDTINDFFVGGNPWLADEELDQLKASTATDSIEGGGTGTGIEGDLV